MIELNKAQKEAAEQLHGIVSVVAVPGSGKTLTMTRRIAFLVTQGVAPENILGLTFTRNAARAMTERLREVLGSKAERVTLSTIHAFCHQLLRKEGRTYEIISGKDQVAFAIMVMKKAKIKNLPAGMILSEIGLAKNNLITAEEFQELYQENETMRPLTEGYFAYEQEKTKRLLYDFNDLLLEAWRMLKDCQDVRDRWRGVYSHILVDEFQDVNPAQMEILKHIAGSPNDTKSSFWICGDDWQSIYAFTGASVGNIIQFPKQFPNCHQFILDLNYRSTPQILTACQNLIGHNTKKIDKTLRTLNTEGEEIHVLEASDEDQEATELVREIRDLTEGQSLALSNIAVLYRANFQSRVIEEAFNQQGVPYQIENGLNFYERREVKILLDYLRLVHSPESESGDEGFRRVINFPNRYVGRSFMAELEKFAVDHDLHLYSALKQMPVTVPYLKRTLRPFIEIIDGLLKDKEKMNPAEMVFVLRESLNYDHAITDEDVPSPDDLKIANINQLQLSAGKYNELSSLLKYTDTFREEKTHDPNGVHLMTIHKAKGLEFNTVFVMGLVDGLLPYKTGDVEEERRIAFVAMSRAMKRLYLTWSKSFMGRPAKKSPFIGEIKGED